MQGEASQGEWDIRVIFGEKRERDGGDWMGMGMGMGLGLGIDWGQK